MPAYYVLLLVDDETRRAVVLGTETGTAIPTTLYAERLADDLGERLGHEGSWRYLVVRIRPAELVGPHDPRKWLDGIAYHHGDAQEL